MKRKKYTTKKTPQKFIDCLASVQALHDDQLEIVRKMLKHPDNPEHQKYLEEHLPLAETNATNLTQALAKATTGHNTFLTTSDSYEKQVKRKNAHALLLEATHILFKTLKIIENAYPVTTALQAAPDVPVEPPEPFSFDLAAGKVRTHVPPPPPETPGALKPMSTANTYRLFYECFFKASELAEDLYYSFRLLDEDYGAALAYSRHSEFFFSATCTYELLAEDVEAAKNALQTFREVNEYTSGVYARRQTVNALLKKTYTRLGGLADFWCAVTATVKSEGKG